MTFDAISATVRYRDIPVLSEANFRYEGNGAMILTGPTGSGKTTFLRLLYADQLPVEGSVKINGTETAAMRSKALRAVRQRMGIVEQDCRLVSAYSVFDNVLMPFAIAGIDKASAMSRCLRLLADMDISYIRHKFPRELSGGERHLVALARAIAMEPEVLIADEPTGTLDDATSERVATTLHMCLDRGMGMIVSTHSVGLASAFPQAERYTMNDGILSKGAM